MKMVVLASPVSTLQALSFSDPSPPYKLVHDHPSLTLLSNCKTLQTLKQIHSQIIKTGLHNTHFALSKLIEFCAVSPHGDLSYALSLFKTIRNPNHVIWNHMIRGLSSSESPFLALEYYVRMISSGTEPNEYTFPSIFKSCTKIRGGHEGKQVHAHVLKLGLEHNAFVHTSLINMYAQNGELVNARLVFDKSSMRDAVSFTALITGYASKGFLDEARELFDEIPVRDVVSWNAMISGYAQSGRVEEAMAFFEEMRRAKVTPNVSTMLSVLSACAQSGSSLQLGNWVRSWIEDRGLGSNLRLVNGLIDMYVKCGDLEEASNLFEKIQDKNVVSWNVMIGGYTHMSCYKEALGLFRRMMQSNIDPNDVTFLSILPACANLGALDLGKWVHAYVDKNMKSMKNTVALWTSLIDMYSKCGEVEDGLVLFGCVADRDVVCWTGIIVGCAQNGRANEALEIFRQMVQSGLKPNEVTYLGVLTACRHAGLVIEAQTIFGTMKCDHRLEPQLEHYYCMVDLLCQAGCFKEVEKLIAEMPFKPDKTIWSSMLGACGTHRNTGLVSTIAENLLANCPNDPSIYVMLSNAYGTLGMWDSLSQVREAAKKLGVKAAGTSWIEISS